MDNRSISNLFDIEKIHTTPLGEQRIAKAFGIEAARAVSYCKNIPEDPRTRIEIRGKNYYAELSGEVITINISAGTIITAKKNKPADHKTEKK